MKYTLAFHAEGKNIDMPRRQINDPLLGKHYSLSLFDHFCPVKRNGEYFAEKWSEQKVLIIKVAGLYSTYQKYKRIGVPSSYQFGENWT